MIRIIIRRISNQPMRKQPKGMNGQSIHQWWLLGEHLSRNYSTLIQHFEDKNFTRLLDKTSGFSKKCRFWTKIAKKLVIVIIWYEKSEFKDFQAVLASADSELIHFSGESESIVSHNLNFIPKMINHHQREFWRKMAQVSHLWFWWKSWKIKKKTNFELKSSNFIKT